LIGFTVEPSGVAKVAHAVDLCCSSKLAQRNDKAPMISSNLQAERDALLAKLAEIRDSGPVAPANVQIHPDFLSPKSWILIHTELPMKERYLGLHGSEKYRDWEARIRRRDQIQELEKQLAIVEELIERQAKMERLFTELPSSIDCGDIVEVGGQRYRVEDVGFKYLRLVAPDGKVTRCEITQAQLVGKS
jgi:hypothetical protein